jgi:histidine triad (HIT) family protein
MSGEEPCVFCDIVTGTEPAHVVHETGSTLAFLASFPGNDGHTLVIPKPHIPDIWALEDPLATEVWRSVRSVADQIERALGPDGLTLAQANRASGFQDVFHFHMHVIPRWRTDTERWTRFWEPPAGWEERMPGVAERLRAAHRS